MIRCLLFVSLITLSIHALAQGISEEERDFAKKYLMESGEQLLATTRQLTEEQLRFKPAPDQWSILECIAHIGIVEEIVWGNIQEALKTPVSAEDIAQKFSPDDMIIKRLESRKGKAKAPERLQPGDLDGRTYEKVLEDFLFKRGRLLSFLESSEADLRAHLYGNPLGNLDLYQWMLFVSAHTVRHTLQIQEVRDCQEFPVN